ncbi:MAG TPA: hypothetical protein VLM05_22315 [Mycobacteriales bacterium]|nr:hypothetical protein [Mycobacteriales bacterium]
MKRARVAMAVGAAGIATVLGITLLTPSGGATPAPLPTLVKDNPVDYTPAINGTECLSDDVADGTCRRTRDITRIGDTVWAGGVIDSVTDQTTGQTASYGNAISFNAKTGAMRPTFKPMFTGATGQIVDGQVQAVERSTYGSAVWFGGDFKKLNGVAAKGLVRWDVPTNKQFPQFNPRIGSDNKTARVYDVKYFCGHLWVAGDFTQVGGVNRTALVSLDPTTGAVTRQVNLGISGTGSSAAGPTRVTRIAPSPDCKRVVIIGNFTNIGGHERYQVAVLNVSATGVAQLSTWYSPFHLRAGQVGVGAKPCASFLPAYVRDVDWAPDGSWWALATTGGDFPYPALCDSVSRWSNSDNPDARPVWINYTGGDTILSVRVVGQQVYVGGHFRELDHAVYRNGTKVNSVGHTHFGLGVINASFLSGMSISGWNEGVDTGRGGGWSAMLPNPGANGTASGLWVGGDDGKINGELGKRIALLPLF